MFFASLMAMFENREKQKTDLNTFSFTGIQNANFNVKTFWLTSPHHLPLHKKELKYD